MWFPMFFPGFSIFALAALLTAVIPAGAAGPEIWHETIVKAMIMERTAISGAGGLRGNTDAGLHQAYLDAGLQYTMVSWLRTGLHFRFIGENKGAGYVPENRPYAQEELVLRTAKGTFSNRHRQELRMREGTKVEMRYRIRIRYRVPATLPKYLSVCHVSCEGFTTDNVTRIGRIWLTLGYRMEWGKIRPDFFLRQQMDCFSTDEMKRIIIIGLNCVISR